MPKKNKNNINLGDVGAIIDTNTGDVVYAIYAVRQGESKIGEVSVCVHNSLFNANINANNPKNAQIGHNGLDIVYICSPNSRQTDLGYKSIQEAGESLFKEYFL